MAKLNEEVFIVKVSELIKDNHDPAVILNEDVINSIEQVIQELAGPGKLVEIIKE